MNRKPIAEQNILFFQNTGNNHCTMFLMIVLGMLILMSPLVKDVGADPNSFNDETIIDNDSNQAQAEDFYHMESDNGNLGSGVDNFVKDRTVSHRIDTAENMLETRTIESLSGSGIETGFDLAVF